MKQVHSQEDNSMASQVHINSLTLGLNFKPWFENFKPGLKTLNPGLRLKVHINSSNRGFNFQTGVSTSQMHFFFLKPRFELQTRV